MVRIKHRYFLMEILEEHIKNLEIPVEEIDIFRGVRATVEKLYGDYGVASVQVGLAIKMFNKITRVFLLRVRAKNQHFVSSSLPFVTLLGCTRVALNLLHVSGTIRSACKFLIRYDRMKLNDLKRTLKLNCGDMHKAVSMSRGFYERLGETELHDNSMDDDQISIVNEYKEEVTSSC